MSLKLLNILIVEDDKDEALIIQKGLMRSFGNNLVLNHARSLSDALKMITKLGYAEIDLILLDVNLPDARRLVGLNTIASAVKGLVPIIMLTGLEDDDLALKAVKTHAQDYLPKHDLQGNAMFRAIQFGLARHEKSIQANLQVTQLQAEISEYKTRKEKLENQAQELEKIALTLMNRKNR